MTSTETQAARVLIIGCGGIGGVLGCELLKQNCNLWIATPNEEVKAVWAKTGPYLDGRLAHQCLPLSRILTSAQDTDTEFDAVFVAVQPTQLETVAKELVGKLSPRGRVVCLPNGLGERRLASILGEDRVVGAVVAWGARMPSPGHYLRTSKGGFLVGTLSGEDEPEMPLLEELMQTVGRVDHTKNLAGARFSKLAINCAVSALGTIGGQTLGSLMTDVGARKLGIALIREAVHVAVADGIKLEAVAKIDIERIANRDPKKKLGRAAQHALLMAVGAKYRRLRSSMLAAIERGREPAVDYINGEVIRLGESAGVPTPVNSAARDIIWSIARGEMQAGTAALRELERRISSAD